MSNNRRRQKPRNFNTHHQQSSTTTHSSNPPPAKWNPSIPAWEKEFCAVVGLVPWSKIEEANRFRSLYDKVVKWDDSVVEETFKGAKYRYWAGINGVSCDSSLPDPDAYIDEVDWDAEVDIESILDFDREPVPITEVDEYVVNLDALFSQQYLGFTGPGWGEAEEVKEENVGKPQKNSWEDQNFDGWNEGSWGRKENVGTGKPENSWEDQNCDGWNEGFWGMKENVGTGKPENSWEDQNCDGWNVGTGKPENSWEVQNCDGRNEDSWGRKENVGSGKPKNSWEDQNYDGWNEDSLGRRDKPGTWDHLNNNNFNTESREHQNNNTNNNYSFGTEAWVYKSNNNKSRHNRKKVENWKAKDQGEWRKRGEVQHGGNRVEDCRWRNERGRSRGGFQQQSNGWDWTTSF